MKKEMYIEAMYEVYMSRTISSAVKCSLMYTESPIASVKYTVLFQNLTWTNMLITS